MRFFLYLLVYGLYCSNKQAYWTSVCWQTMKQWRNRRQQNIFVPEGKLLRPPQILYSQC